MITVLGRIFPAPFYVPPKPPLEGRCPAGAEGWAPKSQGLLTIQTCHPSVADRDSSPQGEPFAGNEMTPDHIGQGSFLFLGFNHWVTSLSVESTEFVDRSPSRGKFSSSASFVFCVYVKRKMLNPAYRCTLHVWCHLFYDNSLSRRKPFCKTENRTNNFRINGIKGRIHGFSYSDN